MTKSQIIAGISAAALAGCIALATVPAHATDPSPAQVAYVESASDASPAYIHQGIGMTYLYHMVATCPEGYVATSASDAPAYADSTPTVTSPPPPPSPQNYILADYNSFIQAKSGPLSDGTGYQAWVTNVSDAADPHFTAVCVLGNLDTP